MAILDYFKNENISLKGEMDAIKSDVSFVPEISTANEVEADFIPGDANGSMIFSPFGRGKSGYNPPSPRKLAEMYVCSMMFWAAVEQITKPMYAASLRLEEKNKKGDWEINDNHEIIQWWRNNPNPEMGGETFQVAFAVHLCVYGVFQAEWSPSGMENVWDRNVDGEAIIGNNDDPAWLTPINPDILRPDIRKIRDANVSGFTPRKPQISLQYLKDKDDKTFADAKNVSVKMQAPDLNFDISTNAHGKLLRYVHIDPAGNGSTGYPVALSDVLKISRYSPERGYRGISPLSLLDDFLGLGGALMKHGRQYLENNATPSGIFEYTFDPSKGQASDVPVEKKQTFIRDWLNKYILDGDFNNTPAFPPGNLKFVPITPELSSILPAELWDIVQAAVHEALGTSAMDSLVGLRHIKSTGAGTKSHQTSVWKYTVEPLCWRFSNTLSKFLIKKFDTEQNNYHQKFINNELRFSWDFSKVPAWQELQEENKKAMISAWESNVPIKVNEMRKSLGLEEDTSEIGNKYSFEVKGLAEKEKQTEKETAKTATAK
jgi:hypothetical protein